MPNLETRSAPEDNTAAAASSPSPEHSSEWWVIPDLPYLLLWWVVIVAFYAVLNFILGRYHRGLIDLDTQANGWYVVLACGLIAAFYAKRFRSLRFMLGLALAALGLMLMLLGPATLNQLFNG